MGMPTFAGCLVMKFRGLILGSILAGFATGVSAENPALCDRLDQAMAATRGDDTQAESVANVLMDLGPSPAACGFSLDLSGSKSANCNWAFSYRSTDAKTEFDTLLAGLSACADPAFAIGTDKPVNHPDFYDLHLFRIAGGEVGLSLKDKVSLDQTFMFLRLTPTG
jgi:hypothetical protein